MCIMSLDNIVTHEFKHSSLSKVKIDVLHHVELVHSLDESQDIKVIMVKSVFSFVYHL